MKLSISNQVPREWNPDRITLLFRQIEAQVNLLAEGRLAGRHFTATSVPTTGDFAKGDIVWKSDPVEAGLATAKYIIIGWINTAAGSPGTFNEMRVLTGN